MNVLLHRFFWNITWSWNNSNIIDGNLQESYLINFATVFVSTHKHDPHASWISCHIMRLIRNQEQATLHCSLAARQAKLILIFILFVHDGCALFTRYLCRGEEEKFPGLIQYLFAKGTKHMVFLSLISDNLIQSSHLF